MAKIQSKLFVTGILACFIFALMSSIQGDVRAIGQEPINSLWEETATELPVQTELESQQETEVASEQVSEDHLDKLIPTHKQIKVIRPEYSENESALDADENEGAKPKPGNKSALTTFCLAYDGTILAGVSNAGRYALQMLSPDGELKQQIDLQFEPQVINQAPDGTIFIAGPGKLAKTTSAGEILASADAPWLGDMEALKKEILEDMKEQYSGILENMESAVERINARIEKLEAQLAEEPSERLEKRLTALKKQRDPQIEQMEMIRGQMEDDDNVENMLSYRLSSTGLAVNSKDLFVCASGKGFRYEVWRMDHEFGSPEKVVDSLSGCCGQCDIQCDEEYLVVAANTEFAVQLRTRDGENVSKFGDRGGKKGFGSCCNPMNVRLLPNGDILTAESSIGWIKKFNREGELLGVIGKAKIGGGCKHVPIGYNKELDRYYMQYEDRSEICVLDPISSITGPTEDEIAAKEAQEGLAKSLIGKWKNTEVKGAAGGFFESLLGVAPPDNPNSMLPFSIEFMADGQLNVEGSSLGTSPKTRWEATRQTGKVLSVAQVGDDESGFGYEIEFLSDSEVQIKLVMDIHEFGRAKFTRETESEKREANESNEPTSSDDEVIPLNKTKQSSDDESGDDSR